MRKARDVLVTLALFLAQQGYASNSLELETRAYANQLARGSYSIYLCSRIDSDLRPSATFTYARDLDLYFQSSVEVYEVPPLWYAFKVTVGNENTVYQPGMFIDIRFYKESGEYKKTERIHLDTLLNSLKPLTSNGVLNEDSPCDSAIPIVSGKVIIEGDLPI